MAYTKDGIMAQIWVAFGQGTGEIRVSQEACWTLHELYYDHIDDDVLNEWDSAAVQALERIRAIGRLAAAKALLVGATVISVADVTSSADTVQQTSGTPMCPPSPI